MPEPLAPSHADAAPRAVAVHVRGTVGGEALDAPGAVHLEPHALSVRVGARTHALPFARLDGFGWRDAWFLVHLDGEGVLELQGDAGALRAFAADALSCATALPELTRALRGLGGSRAGADGWHDRFYGALLDARRAAETATGIDARLEAFDAVRLRAGFERWAAVLAAERFAERPPYRRALEAELLEALEPLLDALDSLGAGAAAVRAAEEARRLAAWRAWVAGARRVFEAADRCWRTVASLAGA